VGLPDHADVVDWILGLTVSPRRGLTPRCSRWGVEGQQVGIGSPCSIRSARSRSVNACTARIASSRVASKRENAVNRGHRRDPAVEIFALQLDRARGGPAAAQP